MRRCQITVPASKHKQKDFPGAGEAQRPHPGVEAAVLRHSSLRNLSLPLHVP
jgi:hypothetical protein